MEYDHLFHRDKGPFEQIITGDKRFEIRLLDEKRKRVVIGDHIKGVLRDDEEQYFISRVTGLSYFSNFEDVFHAFGDKVPPSDRLLLQEIYSPERVRELGIVIIHFAIMSTNTT